MKKIISLMLSIMLIAVSFTACSAPEEETNALAFDNSLWQYNADDDVYYQMGVVYCAEPQDVDYESFAVYVPAVYVTAEDNGDGTFTCSLSEDGKIGDFTSLTAPIVMPVETPGYSLHKAPTSYGRGISEFTNEGIIYVEAGCRGRSNMYDADGSFLYDGGAPWGVTDLKAAVRYLRYNDSSIAGDSERIFTFGHSGGGAQSSLMGATGDSGLYTPYLEKIGAVMEDDEGNALSDAVFGVMAWCPVTSLDYADAAYEWNMGQYDRTGLDVDTQKLSDGLAASFGAYIDELGLKDEDGNTLRGSDGSYEAYLLSVVNQSLNNFIADTEFPYTWKPSFSPNGQRGDGVSANEKPNEEKTFGSLDEYFADLNSDEQWVIFDGDTASVTSLDAFVRHCKNVTKAVGAFDDLEKAQAENDLFGTGSEDALHFDAVMSELLGGAFQSDLDQVDVLGNTVTDRVDMYNPMYYLLDYYDGSGKSTVAPNWRIRSGITQGDTALTVEMNLALALAQYGENVDFETVWGQGHIQAERTGTSTENFIEWVKQLC
jgi:hypothetical protein